MFGIWLVRWLSEYLSYGIGLDYGASKVREWSRLNVTSYARVIKMWVAELVSEPQCRSLLCESLKISANICVSDSLIPVSLGLVCTWMAQGNSSRLVLPNLVIQMSMF